MYYILYSTMLYFFFIKVVWGTDTEAIIENYLCGQLKS